MIKAYYRLAKPGIVYGNLLTTIAAYLYATKWMLVGWPTWANFLATVFGLGLVIASGCVFNNFIDRDIDANMQRTKDRALAIGSISNQNAILYGVILGLIGFTLLIAFVNLLATLAALIGFIVYVFAYTFLKRKTQWATEIGSIAGAMPIVVGYVAATNAFNGIAFILFLVLVFWQMPHFYAIAMYRYEDYALANLPVLPLKKGMRDTKVRVLFYIVLFALATFALTFFGHAGYWYLVIVEIMALVWFWRAAKGLSVSETQVWARKLFFFSLWVLLTFCAMLSVAALLP